MEPLLQQNAETWKWKDDESFQSEFRYWNQESCEEWDGEDLDEEEVSSLALRYF